MWELFGWKRLWVRFGVYLVHGWSKKLKRKQKPLKVHACDNHRVYVLAPRGTIFIFVQIVTATGGRDFIPSMRQQASVSFLDILGLRDDCYCCWVLTHAENTSFLYTVSWNSCARPFRFEGLNGEGRGVAVLLTHHRHPLTPPVDDEALKLHSACRIVNRKHSQRLLLKVPKLNLIKKSLCVFSGGRENTCRVFCPKLNARLVFLQHAGS